MARPLKEGMDYFPHDTDASNDEKIEALRSIHGNNGYAFYFILLERIYRTPNFELDVSASETGEEMKQVLAKKIAVTIQEFNQMLETAFRWGCFDRQEYIERGVLTSNGIKKRASAVLEKRRKMRSLYEQRVSEAETREETIPETPQSKVKKSKEKNIPPYSPPFLVNNSNSSDDQCPDGHSIRGDQCSEKQAEKKIKYAEFVSLTNDEYSSLVAKLGNEDGVKRCIEILDNYKGANGKKYKSDYRAILNWVIDRHEAELPKHVNVDKEKEKKKEIIKALYHN